MVIAGLRFILDNYKAVQEQKKTEVYTLLNRNQTWEMYKDKAVWRFNRGLMVPTGLSFVYEIKPPILEYKVQI